MEVATENGTLLQNITHANENRDLKRPISNHEIISSAKPMHANLSPGPDDICIEMLKHTFSEIVRFLNILFNKIYDKGKKSQNWYENIICPIYKSGSEKDPANFRGIF